MTSYMEHANISVTDLDATLAFIHTAMPDFRVRHDSGPGPDRWVHVGTDQTYLCINQMENPRPPVNGQGAGVNHIGFAVDDVDSLHKRMTAAGYREGFVPQPHPHRKRVYFLDPDGMEYEFVQYYSADPAEKNAY